jgi:mannose-6-phosphate isomerase-like protein (cupin superfamily)
MMAHGVKIKMSVADTSNAEHYLWGDGCSGWHLLNHNDFSVIEECVPPGQNEQRHFHLNSRQFFYILQGEAVLEIDGNVFTLGSRQGIEVPPKVAHQFRNESSSEVRFLVVSVPKAHGDRVTM